MAAPRGSIDTGTTRPSFVADPAGATGLHHLHPSSGMPGVAVSHGALSRHIAAMAHTLELRPEDRVLQFAALTFDVSAEEIFTAWASGAALVLQPAKLLPSIDDFVDFLAAHAATVVGLPAPYWHEWVDEIERGGPMPPAMVRCVIVGNDVVRADRLRVWRERVGASVTWLNAYGPTEGVITSTVQRYVGTDESVAGPRVPIGRALGARRMRIVDRQGHSVPEGVPGEILIGGEVLARGYWGRPDLTAERFVPDSHREPGARAYRTGDRGQNNARGEIEFLGRIDRQIKLRGYRIEPGEIEQTLLRQAAVRDAVVERGERGGQPILIAYVAGPDEAERAAVVGALRARLPSYMIPAAFVWLSELPRTLSGKLDRRALPAVAERSAEAVRGSERRSQREQVLSGIWADVLGVAEVGREDNFFALGGHSLLAMRVVSRVRQAFGIELPLREVFEAEHLAALAARLDGAASGEAVPELVAVERGAALPLSYAQARLWFLDQLEPGSAFYNIPAAYRLGGRLDRTALERSVESLVRRHEILRTRFETIDGEPMQVIAAEPGVVVAFDELGELGAEAREQRARDLAEQEAMTPFDLARGPLLRVRLVRLDEEDHLLLVTLHHSVADGWSMDLLVREFGELYGAHVTGQPLPLGTLAVQYADYAVWQRAWLRGAVLERQLAYWRERLAGAPGVLDLPTDRPRPAVQSYRGADCSVSVPASLRADLVRLGRRHDVTLFMSLLAAFGVLLHRISGQHDLCVGTPVANRGRVELEGLIGLFVNTLVMRVDLRGNPPLSEVLRRVREASLGAQAHQDLPFEQLVEALQPERSLAHSPLFQVMFNLQQGREERSSELPGLSMMPYEARSGTAMFDLTLDISDDGEALHALLNYNADLFDEDTMAKLARRYVAVLELLVVDAARPIGTLNLLLPGEVEQVVPPLSMGVQQLARAEQLLDCLRTPTQLHADLPALRVGDEVLSYGAMWGRVERVARGLRGRGVGPERIVGVLGGRTVETVIGILAVLRAGGAYLPLDPDYPDERLAYMLGDAGVALVLMVGGAGRLSGELGCPVVDLDDLDGDAAESAPFGGDGRASAYVIYTSGSTGQPKGVCVTQRNAVQSLAARVDYYREPLRGFLMVSSFSFDSSVAGIFWTLSQGGELVLPADGVQQDVAALAELIRRGGISHVLAAPVLYRALLEELAGGAGELRVAIVAGEACPAALVARHRELLPEVALYNEYGPTEASVWSTVYRVGGEQAGDIVPIGRPIANTHVVLVDRYGEPVPPGVTGEIWIGGAGVSRGYVGRGGLTAVERFVLDPFVGAGSVVTGPVIWGVTRRAETWSSSVGWMIRPRFGAIGSNWARSRRGCASTRACARRRCGWWARGRRSVCAAMWSEWTRRRVGTDCDGICCIACRSTWCRRCTSRWRVCR
ncbi:MAG: AMP-binding protein [Methylotetracoccus sp.]